MSYRFEAKAKSEPIVETKRASGDFVYLVSPVNGLHPERVADSYSIAIK